MDAERHITTLEIAEKLKLSNSAVYDHSKRLGFVSKLDTWVHHKINGIDLVRRIINCDSLLKREENDLFFKRIMTGDEDIYQKKVMLSVWWNRKPIIFFEILPNNQTIIADMYYR